ncbi:phage tail protein [Paenibacillus massiliensis]|uniref:phage tail protein n=1 Tax=Paenibacillus massiliensis TaxID=225917 RepID=UPI00041A3C71|nr:tail fiber protein [Paenibacillus massiliensis]
MAIQEPRKFVTTDQGHADVLNVPIATLYANDKELDELKDDKRMTVIDPATINYNLENLKPGKYFIQIPDGQKLAGEPIRDLTIGRSVVVTVGRPDTVTNVIVRTFLYTSYTTGAHARFFYQPRTIINPTVPSPWYEWETVSGSAAKLADHANNADLHITKQYVETYAATKVHTHSPSDLPSATTQARGIVQLNNSTSSTATDQAATPSAVKAAYDRANEAFTQVSDGKNLLAAAIRDKNQPAQGSDPFVTLAAAIRAIVSYPRRADVADQAAFLGGGSVSTDKTFTKDFFTFPAGSQRISFIGAVSCSVQGNGANTSTRLETYIEMVDNAGVVASILFKTGENGSVVRYGFIFDGPGGHIRYENYTTAPIPSNFNINGPIILRGRLFAPGPSGGTDRVGVNGVFTY